MEALAPTITLFRRNAERPGNVQWRHRCRVVVNGQQRRLLVELQHVRRPTTGARRPVEQISGTTNVAAAVVGTVHGNSQKAELNCRCSPPTNVRPQVEGANRETTGRRRPCWRRTFRHHRPGQFQEVQNGTHATFYQHRTKLPSTGIGGVC